MSYINDLRLLRKNKLLLELQDLGFDYSIDEYGTCANKGGDVIFEADTIEDINNELESMIDEIRSERRMAWSD